MLYFVAVAEELHFSRAAERLQMTQPPLSKQINKLEQELGLKLFERTKRRVTLTNAGKIYFKDAQKILDMVDISIQKTKQIASGERGLLKIATITSSSVNVLPPIILSHKTSYPNVKVHVFEMNSKEQVQALLDNTIDIGFLSDVDSHKEILHLLIHQEPLVIALPKNHHLAQHEEVSIEDLRNESFIIFLKDLSTPLTEITYKLCIQAGFEPNIVHEAIHLATIVSLVAARLGVAIVPECMMEYHASRVIYLPLRNNDVMLSIFLAWLKTNNKQQLLKHFINTCLDCSTHLN